MKSILLKLALVAWLCVHVVAQVSAQVSAFTYQGRLCDGAQPASGLYDLTFTLYAGPAGEAILTTNGVPVTNGLLVTNGVPVTHGVFTVALDFEASLFDGSPRWLQIAVRTNGTADPFRSLYPLQPITAAPYSIHATSAGRAAAAATADAVPWAGVSGLPAGFADGVDNDTTYTAGDGLTLSGTTFSQDAAYGDARYWRLGGNAGTTAGPQFVGTTDNQPLELIVNGQRVLRLEPDNKSPNVIGGYAGNRVAAGLAGATIGGGGYEGAVHEVLAGFGTLGGGWGNRISGGVATIGGGGGNQAGGGYALIGGGFRNQADGLSSVVGGGYLNSIQTNANYSTIGGGEANQIENGGGHAVIAGGADNVIGVDSAASAIGGGAQNVIQSSTLQSAIGGGAGNAIHSNCWSVTIAGGEVNIIESHSQHSTIGGGNNNRIESTTFEATIGGGDFNNIETAGHDGTIGGGQGNRIQAHVHDATIGGGFFNTVQLGARQATVGGGSENFVGGERATIAGGWRNQATGSASAIGGGSANYAVDEHATVPGGAGNVAGGRFSFAAGHNARALHEGAFVWADSHEEAFGSTAPNQFLLRADRVGIGTNGPLAKLDVEQHNAGMAAFQAAHVSSGNYGLVGGSWYSFYAAGPGTHYAEASSARWKQNVQPIPEPLTKLGQLRGVYFDWDAEHGGHHDVGMIAEEVGAILPEIVAYEPNGADARGMDYSKLGPLLVEAVKALKERADEQQSQLERKVQEQQHRIAALERDVNRLQVLLGTLQPSANGGAR